MSRWLYTILSLAIAVYSTSAQSPYELTLQEQTQQQTHDRGDKLRAYRVGLYTGQPYRVDIPDTLTYGTHHRVAPEGRSLAVAYQGNAGGPWQSKLFFDRALRQPEFVYLDGLSGLLYSPEYVPFYDTRTPFTFVHYRKNFSDDVLEEVIDGTLSLNLGPKLNLGVATNYVGSEGYYESARAKSLSYRLQSSYRSDRYDLWAYIANNDHRQRENAGIANIDYLLNPDRYSSGRVRITSKDIPVQLPGNLLTNRLTAGHGFLSHRYKLGSYRTVQVVDTLASPAKAGGAATALLGGEGSSSVATGSAPTDTAHLRTRDSVYFVPVGNIGHQIYYSRNRRHMVSRSQDERWLTFFGEPTANIIETTDDDGNVHRSVLPDDEMEHSMISNTLSLSLMEGFRPWVKAGLTAYIRTENHWIRNPKSTGGHATDRFFSTFVGAELARHEGRGLNFSLRGDLGLLGRDLGSLDLSGDIRTRFRLMSRDFGLRADARLTNLRAPYYLEHHHGTWGWWDRDLGFERRLELGARADLSSWGTWVEVRTASVQNHHYWLSDGTVGEHTPLVQVSMLRLGHRGRRGVLGWALEGAYQMSTDSEVITLPALAGRADLYLQFYIAGVLQVQLGVEGYWHSAYHAPYYLPTVMQFVQQREAMIGGKTPLLNAYANFRHKNTRFYVRMFNATEAITSTDRLSMYRYATNPMHLEAGIVVDLKQ